MKRARRLLAHARRLARDPGASVVLGTATGALAGVLAIVVSPLWLLLALAAPMGRWFVEQSAARTGVPTDGDCHEEPLVEETVTEVASDRDWIAVADGGDGKKAESAQLIRTSRSDISDVEGSYVEF